MNKETKPKIFVRLGYKEARFVMDMCEQYIESLGHGLTLRNGQHMTPSELHQLDCKISRRFIKLDDWHRRND